MTAPLGPEISECATTEIANAPTRPFIRPRTLWRRGRPVMAAACALGMALTTAIVLRHEWIPVSRSQFSRDTGAVGTDIARWRSDRERTVTNQDGTVHYLNEEFDEYGEVNSWLVDGMESTGDRRQVGGTGQPRLGDDSVQGLHSILVQLANGGTPVVLRTMFQAPQNLARWAGGYLTCWMRLSNRTGIRGVSVLLGDATGATRELEVLPNLQSDYPNFPNTDDPFPNLRYPDGAPASEWTDYRLVRGWNLLLWNMADTDFGSFDFAAVTSYDIVLHTTEELRPQGVLFDDVRLQDGVQTTANATAGNWRPPLGMPQYGVLDIDDVGDGAGPDPDYALHLLNVRQRQYPSNGDHGRVLSAWGTPMDFALRTRFTLHSWSDRGSEGNTWFRVLYDFDPDYDPGHDWFGGYLSLEYDKAGLVTVIPLERFSVQTQEPEVGDEIAAHRKSFDPEPETLYEYQMTVRGQTTEVTIYEVRGERLYQKVTLRNTFDRERRVDRRHPFGFEITGDVTATIYAVEMVEV